MVGGDDGADRVLIALSRTAAGKPTALAVSRPVGSPSRLSFGSSGRFFQHQRRDAPSPVQTKIWFGRQNAAQPIVAELKQAFAADDRSSCLGMLPRESGQSRVPDPPAMMTPYCMLDSVTVIY